MRRPPAAIAPVLRQPSTSTVLEHLWSVDEATGSEIMQATGLSRPTVHGACEDLIDRGLVIELPARPTGERGQPGRPSRCYQFNAAGGSVLGIDLGEWKVTVLHADLRGRPLGEVTADLRTRSVDARERVTATRACIRRLVRGAPATTGPILCASIGVAAAVDLAGRIYPSPDPTYLPGMADLDLPSVIGRGYPWPVLVDNDANLALIAERHLGAAVGAEDAILLLAGERMGAGILANGALVRGHGGAAGELALLELVTGVGDTHGIGALARMLAEAALGRREGSPGIPALPPFTEETLRRLRDDDADHVTAKLVADAARAADPTARTILDLIASRTARTVGVLSSLLNPELVIIAGGASPFLELIKDSIAARLPAFVKQRPTIQASALGDQAVVLGAVWSAVQHVRTTMVERLGEPASATATALASQPRESAHRT